MPDGSIHPEAGGLSFSASSLNMNGRVGIKEREGVGDYEMEEEEEEDGVKEEFKIGK